jgi:hypothetical protein
MAKIIPLRCKDETGNYCPVPINGFSGADKIKKAGIFASF